MKSLFYQYTRCSALNNTQGQQRGFGKLLVLGVLIVMSIWGLAVYQAAETFRQFLTENRDLKAALARLTQEDQIGYARVVDQSTDNGGLYTTLAFFQTDRDEPERRVYQGEFTIRGDIAHFDSLVVKFDPQLVLDGEHRSIYLWRRIYDEYTPPGEGQLIESPDEAPARYRALLPDPTCRERLTLAPDFSQEFWTTIWDLANDTEALREYGISAVYGNTVHTRLEPGKVYQFKINGSGQIWPQVVENW
jgi:hypothetical protein